MRIASAGSEGVADRSSRDSATGAESSARYGARTLDGAQGRSMAQMIEYHCYNQWFLHCADPVRVV
jgi:hypothetical protein